MNTSLLVFILFISCCTSQQTILVVILPNEPFINVSDNGISGYSIEVFENVLDIMNLNYGYNIIPSYVISQSIAQYNDFLRVSDFGISSFSTTPDQQILFGTTVPYHYSILRAVVQSGKIPTTLGQIWLVFRDSHFLQFLLLFMLFCIPAANLMWAIEFRYEDEHSKYYFPAIGSTIYWTWITFYGAGDKVPSTAWGKAATVLILIISLVLMNLVTGAIAATLTVNSLDVDPLSILEFSGEPVSAVRGSYSASLAQQADSKLVLVDNVQEGADLVDNGTVVYFVNEQASLLAINRSSVDIFISGMALAYVPYSFMYSSNTSSSEQALVTDFNFALTNFKSTQTYSDLLHKYFTYIYDEPDQKNIAIRNWIPVFIFLGAITIYALVIFLGFIHWKVKKERRERINRRREETEEKEGSVIEEIQKAGDSSS